MLKMNVLLLTLLLLGGLFSKVTAQNCLEDPYGGEYFEFFDADFDDVLILGNFIGTEGPQLIQTLNPGQTFALEVISGQNTLVGDGRVIENLVFFTGCRGISVQGDAPTCEQNGGAGEVCTRIYECQDFHIWTPPATTITPCDQISFSLPSLFGAPPAAVSGTITYTTSGGGTPDTLILNTPNIQSGTYEAAEAIIVSESIAPGANVTFKSGVEVILEPGFVAPANSTVQILICPPTPSLPSNPHLVNHKIEQTIEANGMQLLLYPNPTSDVLYLAVEDELSSDAQVLIQDQSGKILKRYTFPYLEAQQLEIPISDLQEGLYYVSLHDKQQQVTKQFMIAAEAE